MPKFLEQKLRAEYGNNPSAIYGTMNKLGAMHGNKETAKGREMEKKHEAKMKKVSVEPMREMRIEMHRGPNKELTGFTVHHSMMPKSSKSMAFSEQTSHSQPFGADQHEEMMDHIHEHTAAQLGGKMAKAEREPSPAEEVAEGEEA